MYLYILYLPIYSFFVSLLLSRYFDRDSSLFFSVFLLGLSFLCACFIFYEVCFLSTIVHVNLFDWVFIGLYRVTIGFLFDSVTAIMLVVVTGISFLVHVYSLGYMGQDPNVARFFSYLSLFTFFMLVLVTSSNFVEMFIGWEGVGLCSYLLINFWFTRLFANKAALKAMIVNRISDVFFIYGIILIFLYVKNTDYVMTFNLLPFILSEKLVFLNDTFLLIDVICFFLFIGSIGKSAQIGLHTWLPDAMEGPTPVSSLLHAATMVTAGVFLILKCSILFENSSFVLLLIVFFGGVTALFSSIIGVFQYDFKKIIAYSTCSQLGYMFFSAGLSNYDVALFHLFNHAFFKALLFLSAGSVIHAIMDEQDIRRMGSFVNLLPLTYLSILVGSLAILGFPFLTGFYSKDLLLELSFTRFHLDSLFVFFLGLSAAFFTSVYSFRLLGAVFISDSFFYKNVFYTNAFKSFVFQKSDKNNVTKWGIFFHENNTYMIIPMIILSFLSILVGFVFSDAFVGWGSFLWNGSLAFSESNFSHIESEFLSPLIKNMPLFVSVIGFFIIFKLTEKKSPELEIARYLSEFFFSAGFFNYVYNRFLNLIFQNSYAYINKFVDKGLLEFFGPFGLYKFFRSVFSSLKEKSPVVIFFNMGFQLLVIALFLFFILSNVFFFQLFSDVSGVLFYIIILVSLSSKKIIKK